MRYAIATPSKGRVGLDNVPEPFHSKFMSTIGNLPAVRLSQFAVKTAIEEAEAIRPLCRLSSPSLVTQCRQAGLPMEMAELCAGLLASVIDDLIMVSRLPRTDFERSKREERILAASNEPALSALRIAIACSPINGRAAVRHWDAICERYEVGKLAFLLGLQTDTGMRYAKKLTKLQNYA